MTGKPLTTRQRCLLSFRSCRRQRVYPSTGEDWAGWVLHHAGRYKIPETVPAWIRQEAEDFLLKVKREATCPSPRS